ncbi:MAG: hypothetical protein R2761_26520 [Acidimicrobiales bacterium]
MPVLSSRRRAASALWVLLALLVAATGACSDGGVTGGSSPLAPDPSAPPATTTSPAPPPSAGRPPASEPSGEPTSERSAPAGTSSPSAAEPCGRPGPAPAAYEHVVVVLEENRTWGQVGGVGFGDMAWLGQLAAGCTVYTDWRETNPGQNSLTQYIGLTSGVDNPATVNDCKPSDRCRSTDDNIFRQVREAGGTARTYVEGATTPCSAQGNAAKHIPALYYQGGDDPAHCDTEVRPLGELDPDHLPTYAMIVPDLCHDGHDCDDDTVDSWLADHLGPVLDGADYRAGTTAVFVLWDEDHPVPNLVIAPTATAGRLSLDGAGHAAALRTMEELLGLPLLAGAADAPSLRPSANL